MRDYELIMIISPEIDEEELLATIEKVNGFITSKGGEIIEVDQWGKRKLAYPINRFREGNYVLDRFKLTQGLTAELEASLQISEKILRHLLVRLDNQKPAEGKS
ncbi:MAG TPA: 30S ribosomal protein S6 [Dehalococcoidia bacterium]|nr:30S ribosomal protein S6 [Dehalococcoidia bacterium]